MENIEISKKRKIIYLIIEILVIFLITLSSRLLKYINIYWIKFVLKCVLNILLGISAYVFIKLSKMKVDYGFKNGKSYLIGLVIAIVLELIIGIVPLFFNSNFIGEHEDFKLWSFLLDLFNYLIIIGPIEELIFRVYIQDTFISLLNKNKWIGVIISSFIFGFWHIINGNIIQVIFTSFIGMAFGFSKYYINNCKYSAVAFGHGLYDFLHVVTRILFIK